MKEQIRKILSVVMCALVLFSGILIVNYDEHIHLGEDHLHTQDVQDDHAHEQEDQGVLSVLENVVEFLLCGLAMPVHAAYEDGVAVQTYWREKKKTLHVCLPHTALQEVDYQLDEAVGCLYVKDYDSALPKVEVLLGLSESIPHSYSFNLQNIF